MNDWLLDSDPAIRWQVLGDLTGASADEVAAERARVATFGLDPSSPEAVTAARRRGEEYLLERGLLRRRSTGERIERDRKGGGSWTRFAPPAWWHYDVLRGLDRLRHARVAPDARVREAVELVASKRDHDGRWPLEVRHAGTMPIEIDEGEARPSRWITFRALRILKWAS